MARPHLVTLPYEVRDKIFQEYFRVEGGYVFNSESEKLTTADGQPIDFSLMHTCRLIAKDTRHLPFAVNNISFSTFSSPEWMAWAGRHQFLSQFLCLLKADLIYHLQGPKMSPELESALQDKFPHLMPDFKHRLENKGGELVRLWGINAGMAREAIAFSLRFLGERQYFDLAGLLNKAFPGWKGSNDPQDLLDLSLDPWDIPSKVVLTRAGRLLRDDAMWRRSEDWDKGLRAKYRFSAAAVAIRFFRQLSVDQRRKLRFVTIIEDAYAVCSPSTHAMGLIEFCEDNPRLRIKRHLKLSRRIPAAFHPFSRHFGYSGLGRHLFSEDDGGDYMDAWVAVAGVSTWLEEAITLPDAGMPPNSFTLFLDGEPDKSYFSNIFQNTLVRHGPLMHASKRLYRTSPQQFDGAPPYRLWQRVELSKAVEYLTKAHSTSESTHSTPLIRSNFHPGQPPDIESII
ncbi:hypothetical protein FPHYL_10343 [Fusarium phyllophilum]|uniref:Uncharacterized protein n=1 Tax=Fusarium phyllophilum TaxID=47803 RepID=A0A8H5J5Y8_9HYPO|nr:hypothetical protein FPHYL_10343 [Fusarium phyllophilum]